MTKQRNYQDDHFDNVEAFVKRVRALYYAASREASQMASGVKYDPNKPFRFSNFPPLNNRVRKLFVTLTGKMLETLNSGTQHEWLLSAEKNDQLVKTVLASSKLSAESLSRYQNRNLEALRAFQNRKSDGIHLSDRIWKVGEQFRQELEMAIDVGLGEGRSADQLSADVRLYLEDPDKLFRRVRDARGMLHLSQNAKAFSPGQGVYRSSYKNAMRLTRSEINMAYRESDWARWSQLDFVVGYEVRRSNNPYPCVVCESLKGRYPKTFKWRSWHPQCRCYMIAILASKSEIDKMTESILNEDNPQPIKSENEVDTMPAGFVSWIKGNKPRLLRAKSQPYFIQDNFKGGNIAGGLNIPLRKSGLTKTDILRNQPFELTEDTIASLVGTRNIAFNGTANNFNKILRGFDLPSFDAELTEIAAEKGFTWETKSYSADERRVYFEYSGQYQNDWITLIRSFSIKDGKKVVDHDLFMMPSSLQGSGLSKQIFRRLYRQYQNAGVQRINVHANIDVGGYAWAKYGFSMIRKGDVEALKTAAKIKLSAKKYKDFMEVYDLYKDIVPFPVKHIANQPYGKQLLLESDWYGSIDLEDDDETEYFEKYLFGK